MSIAEPLAALLLLGAPAPAPAEAPDARVRQWVADLARDDFAARDAASKALVEAGDAAVPALESAAKDVSPEVQSRARDALKAIENRKIQPGKVLEILHGSAAFVEGGNLTLRDALKPLEKLGLRVDYDREVDPAQPCSLTKHGQTALELVDQLAETCRLGFRIVPGGVRVVTKEALDALHADLDQRFRSPMTVEFVDTAFRDVVKEIAEKLKAPLVLSPEASEEWWKPDEKVLLKVQQVPVRTILNLLSGSRGLPRFEAHAQYGLVVLFPK